MKQKWLLLVVLGLAIIGLVAVFSGRNQLTEVQMPDGVKFSANDSKGQPVQLDRSKTTVLFFMAAWCTSCYEVESNLKQLQNDHKVQLITIDVDAQSDREQDLAAFQKKYGGDWAHILDKDSKLMQQFKIDSLDTVIIIKDGKIVHRSIRPSIKTMQEVIHG